MQNQRKQQEGPNTNRILFSLYLGFFAGLFWTALKIIAYYLGFTNVIPGFISDAFFRHEVLTSWGGHGLGWLFFTMFSILACLLYAFLFTKLQGPWPGIFYGAGWWVLIYVWLGPVTGMTKKWSEMDTNSIITDLCLFLVWGLFIGYTITYEFTEERMREPKGSPADSKA